MTKIHFAIDLISFENSITFFKLSFCIKACKSTNENQSARLSIATNQAATAIAPIGATFELFAFNLISILTKMDFGTLFHAKFDASNPSRPLGFGMQD